MSSNLFSGAAKRSQRGLSRRDTPRKKSRTDGSHQSSSQGGASSRETIPRSDPKLSLSSGNPKEMKNIPSTRETTNSSMEFSSAPIRSPIVDPKVLKAYQNEGSRSTSPPLVEQTLNEESQTVSPPPVVHTTNEETQAISPALVEPIINEESQVISPPPVDQDTNEESRVVSPPPVEPITNVDSRAASPLPDDRSVNELSHFDRDATNQSISQEGCAQVVTAAPNSETDPILQLRGSVEDIPESFFAPPHSQVVVSTSQHTQVVSPAHISQGVSKTGSGPSRSGFKNISDDPSLLDERPFKEQVEEITEFDMSRSDYTGQRESRKAGLGNVMGKTRKVSKGYSTGFVLDYRHAMETMAESEGFGCSGRVDSEMAASENSCALKRKSISLNVDSCDQFGVPMRVVSLSRMSHLERRDLEMRLKSELGQVRMLQGKIASFRSDTMVLPPTTDIHSHQNGPKRPAVLENSTALSKKKGSSGRNGPRNKGGAVAARKSESVNQWPPQNTSFVMLMKQCETLLTRVMAHKDAWIFNEPVDVVKHKIPDYFNVIKHPMDLGTVKRKLLSCQYSSPMGFATDVRLTFQNALTYNPAGHDVYIMAEILSKYFEVRWKPIEKKIPAMPAIADESTASKSSVVVEPESAHVPPSKKQKTTSLGTKVKQETGKRVMSALEKQNLSRELEDSLAELPENIIDFLKESTLNGNQVSEDEIEIDIDTLSDDTLFILRKLLDDYLLEIQKNQTKVQPCVIEIHNESGFSNLSMQPSKENEPADEDVDIGGDEPPPISSSTPIEVDKDVARRNSNCSSSSSSGSESGSSSSAIAVLDVMLIGRAPAPPSSLSHTHTESLDGYTDSGSSSGGELNGAMNSVPASTVNEAVDPNAEQKERDLDDPNSPLNSIEPKSNQEGEIAPLDRPASPEKLYRAALLRSRFADIIIKAQENTSEKAERPDPDKLKLEREELERRRREEKARLRAEAKAAEEARKKAEEEAATEAKRKRELEREAARQALQKMEKTVDISENSQFMEDLNFFKPDDDSQNCSIKEEASPEYSQNGLGSFKFEASINPLEQLGLYMKNYEEDEEEVEPPQSNSNPPNASNDPEEGEID
ncbi:hypothetical protein RD792_012981 [Penstemon davidsonii]|uniref:Uncharacterized protein n=1 Tax=Penstemon davidsonii TaxID=160366 RepID=A0ABR0CS52_9LAMI|nr:hypothetical protein RD792_012981 [Penstemon davidsonii]